MASTSLFSPVFTQEKILIQAKGWNTISPNLLTACLEGVLRLVNWEKAGLRINGDYLSHFRFADDIVLSVSLVDTCKSYSGPALRKLSSKVKGKHEWIESNAIDMYEPSPSP